MKTIRIFLASSEELKEEREKFADVVTHLNHSLEKREINIILEKWEYLDSSMGPEHKQEEYNKKLQNCDLCLVLWWTRFGDYTKVELDIAYQGLCAGRNPKKLYVYFKEGKEISEDIRTFRDSFPKSYGHFPCHFQNMETLKADFLLQFFDYQGQYLTENFWEIRESQVIIDGKVYVDLKEVPFVGKNDEYKSLLREIDKTQKLLSFTDANDPEYNEYENDLANLNERKKTMEENLWSTALKITELSNRNSSERLQRAIQLFNQGNNKGAHAILNEEEISREAQHNINLINLGEEGKIGLEINIEELLLKIKTLKNEQAAGWRVHVNRIYMQCVEYARKINKELLSKILGEYGSFLLNTFRYAESIKVLQEALELYEDSHNNNHHNSLEHAAVCGNLGTAYYALGEYEKSYKFHKDSLTLFKCNDIENVYQGIFISISYADDLKTLGKYEEALKQIDYTFLLLENCKEWDFYKNRLILRAITSKLKILCLFKTDNEETICDLLNKGLTLCDQIKSYPNENIKLPFYQSAIGLSIRFDSMYCNPLSFWFNRAKSEINQMGIANEEISQFDLTLHIGVMECSYYIVKNREQMRKSYMHLYNLYTDSLKQNQKIKNSHFSFLFFSLFLGYFDNNCRSIVDQLIKEIGDKWNELPSLKRVLDFQILTYNCLTTTSDNKLNDIKKLYNIYISTSDFTIEKFLDYGRSMHADFLNLVCYEILIPENKYNEALNIIENVLLLCPFDENYLDSKAEILYRMGKVEEALSLAIEVYNIDPQFYPDGNEFLYSELSRFEKWREFIESNSTREIIEIERTKVLTRIEKDEKYGFADELGNEIIPCKWDWAVTTFHENLAAVMDSNGNWGFIDKNGKVIIPCQWKEALSFYEGLCAVRNDDGEWGYIDKANNVIIPFQWKSASIFMEGLAYVKDANNLYGYIDKTGMVVIPCKWKRTEWFSEGLAAVQDANNKWGYIDKTGNMVIPCQWDWAEKFQGGAAQVLDGNRKYCHIDKTGKVVG